MKILVLITGFVVLVLPGLVLLWMTIFGLTVNESSVPAAVMLFFVGLFLIPITAVSMESRL